MPLHFLCFVLIWHQVTGWIHIQEWSTELDFSPLHTNSTHFINLLLLLKVVFVVWCVKGTAPPISVTLHELFDQSGFQLSLLSFKLLFASTLVRVSARCMYII